MTLQTEQVKHIADVVVGSTIIASLLSWLPPIAAILGIIYTTVRIYETKTCTRFIVWIKQL